jgi:hypothetical protein
LDNIINKFILANFECSHVHKKELIYDKVLNRYVDASDLLSMMRSLFNLTDTEIRVYFTRVFPTLDRYWTIAWCDYLPIAIRPMVIGDDSTISFLLNRYSLQELNERLYNPIRVDTIN